MPRKKSTQRTVIAVVFVLVAVVVGVVVGYEPAMRYFALEQAKNYHPSNWCNPTPTRGYHAATKQFYTFPNSCLPQGWEEAAQ